MKQRLVICCDGTWNDLEMRYITNVGRLVQALLPEGKSDHQPIQQVVYYDDGVGADAGGVQRLLQGGFGFGIDNLIYEAYRHICLNYREGDQVCLFGFSRGAFTVRSLAGMIARVGLVPRSQLKHVPGALGAYRSKNDDTQKAFKAKAKGRDISIDLLACWDTVGALGIPDKIPFLSIDEWSNKKYRFHDTVVGRSVKRAIHAVAIDDIRKEFAPTLMKKAYPAQKVVQRWFPGDHGCVGGGSWEKRALSNRCLKWVIDQAKDLGIELGVDWRLLHDEATSDHSIFFMPTMKAIYTRQDRPMRKNQVQWEDIDQTARDRWVEDPTWRPPALKRRFGTRLNKLSSGGVRRPPVVTTRLKPGQSVDVRVFARSKNSRSHVEVKTGQVYRIAISPLQVWKDAHLDPCDIRGWNLIEEGKDSKLPYEEGKQVNPSAVKSWLFKQAERKKLVREADWFELVAGVGLRDYARLHFRKPAKETAFYEAVYTVRRDGELFFAANDLASRMNLIDKYDNNTGWIWMRIKREQ